jgi:hypothetical protein
VSVPADDYVVVHRDAESEGDLDDLPGHLDIGTRRGRIAGRMIIHDQTTSAIELIHPGKESYPACGESLAGPSLIARSTLVPYFVG